MFFVRWFASYDVLLYYLLFAYLTATRTQQSISSSAMVAIPILVLFIQFNSFQASATKKPNDNSAKDRTK